MQKDKPRRGYAVGIQEFDTIRTKGSVYVDKTEYVWKMVSADAQTYFLSRPRRFGKTLLVSTLQAYFEGRKELFEGLAISQHETEWKQYPVVRINLSRGKYYEFERVHGTIDSLLRDHEERPDVELLAEKMTLSYSKYGEHYDYDSMLALLKKKYDGYHFSSHFTDIYNPWSLIYAFNEGDVGNYWFGTGTPSSLIDLLRTKYLSMPDLENYRCNLEEFDAPTERIEDPVPVLFQSGYLTLKAYDRYTDEYILGFPNEEVYRGFAGSLYKYYCEGYPRGKNTITGAFTRFRLKQYTLDDFLQAVQQFFAAIPYSITDKNQNEQFYQANLYNLLVAAGAHVHAELQTATGRMDISMKMQDAIYILELKYNKSAGKAISQIKENDYAVAFASDPRPVYAVGLNFTSNSHTLDSWTVEKLDKK